MAKDNKQIGMFRLDGILPAPRGVPRIEVTFDIDTSGVLTVSAKDTGTDKEKHITIQSKSSMTKDEIEKAKRDAAMFADADKKAKEDAEKLNAAEAALFGSENSLKTNKDKLEENEIAEIESIQKDLRKAIDEKNFSEIEKHNAALTAKWTEVSTRLYQKNEQKSETESNDGSQDKSNDNVEEASFEEV